MTPVSSNGGSAGTKVMVSNLPLLFARGSPTSLESMCLEELQLFLKFVLKCEQNSSTLDLDTLKQPAWWPSVPGAVWGEKILSKKEQRGKTSSLLRSAIKACYTYHDCMYLLEFCRKLISFTGGIENLQVVDNRDGTRSLLNRSNKKLLVTFRAENQDYDKEFFNHSGISNAKTSKGMPQLGNVKKAQLVSSKSDNTSDPNLTKCVDVYLCDTCDKDFDNISDLVTHERVCGEQVVAPSIESFLTSLKLHRTGQSLAKREVREKERPRASNYDKFTEIDLSSPLGKYIVTSSGLTIQQMNPAIRGYKSLEEYNAEIDAKCPGTIKSLKNTNAFMDIRGKWNSSYKLSRKKANLWTHTYCFTSSEVEAKERVLRAGLTGPAMRNFRKCQRKSSSVRLKRLPKDLIESVIAKNEETVKKLLTSAKVVKNTARKSFSGYRRNNEDDKVIDELLEDSSDEMESDSKPVPAEPNNIVNFATGFATWTENHDDKAKVFQVKDEADLEPVTREQKRISVPRPLPELQKIYVNSAAQNPQKSQ